MSRETSAHVDLRELLEFQASVNAYVRELVEHHETLRNKYVQLQEDGWDDDNQVAFQQILDGLKIQINSIVEKYMNLNLLIDNKKEIIDSYFGNMENWSSSRRQINNAAKEVVTRNQAVENRHKNLVAEIFGESVEDEAQEEMVAVNQASESAQVHLESEGSEKSKGMKKFYNWLMK